MRRIGFQPTHIHVSLGARTSSDLTITLPRLPVVLTEVLVAGRLLKVPARYEEVYRRAVLGWGKLITHDDTEFESHTTMAVVAEATPLTLMRCSWHSSSFIHLPSKRLSSTPASHASLRNSSTMRAR